VIHPSFGIDRRSFLIKRMVMAEHFREWLNLQQFLVALSSMPAIKKFLPVQRCPFDNQPKRSTGQ